MNLSVKTRENGLIISTISGSFELFLTNYPYVVLPIVFIDLWQVNRVIGILSHGVMHLCYPLKGNCNTFTILPIQGDENLLGKESTTTSLRKLD